MSPKGTLGLGPNGRPPPAQMQTRRLRRWTKENSLNSKETEICGHDLPRNVQFDIWLQWADFELVRALKDRLTLCNPLMSSESQLHRRFWASASALYSWPRNFLTPHMRRRADILFWLGPGPMPRTLQLHLPCLPHGTSPYHFQLQGTWDRSLRPW